MGGKDTEGTKANHYALVGNNNTKENYLKESDPVSPENLRDTGSLDDETNFYRVNAQQLLTIDAV